MAMMQPLASNARTTNVLESFRGGKMKFQTNLAWALIEGVKPHLNVLERNYVFVRTGADDTFAAIHHLLKLIAVKGIPLPPSLVRLYVTWLDSYAFHDEERHLRRLIEGFLLHDAVRALTALCAERTLEVGVARTCSARLDLARGLVVARGGSGPRRELPGSREAGHIGTGLGDDDVGGEGADATRPRRSDATAGQGQSVSPGPAPMSRSAATAVAAAASPWT